MAEPSTANMVKSSSGKLYDAESPQGIMIRTGGGTRAADPVAAGEEKSGIFASILETLQNQTQLLFGIDENTEETPEEKRQKSLNEEDTQKTGAFAGMGGKIGDGLKSVGGFLKNKNPLSTDRNPITRLLGFGALAGLLKLFGDKLTGDEGFLTKILEWFKLTFIPWTVTTWNAIKEFDWEAQFAKVGAFFDKIKNFFVALDTDGDGKISFDELKIGLDKEIDKLKDAVDEGFATFMDDYGKKILAAFVGYKIGKGLISALILGGAPKTGLYAGMRFLGLAGIMTAGLVLLHNDIKDAYDDVMERDGEVNIKTWLSRWLAGENNPEGKSWTDAILGSWKKGLEGAAVGLTAGLVTGGVFSIPLAAVGFITGSIAGAMGIHLGEDKLNKNLEDAEKNLKTLGDDLTTTADRVMNWAKGIVDAAKAILDPGQTMSGAFNLATRGEGGQLYREADITVKNLEAQLKVEREKKRNHLIMNPGSNVDSYDNSIAAIEKDLMIATTRRDEAFQTAENVRTQTRVNKDASLVNQIKELEAVQRNLKPAAAARLQPEIDALKTQRMYLARAGMQSMDTFSSTLDAPELEMPEIKKFRGDNLNNKYNLATSAPEAMANKMENFTQPPGQIINAPTSIKNEGDTHISTLKSIPAYNTSNILSATWTLAYGYPDNHR
ncbi:MAG: EF-hand domain-containing protein [Flavobacteriaceae bacterium]|nr:EF-hand domain-containing protein [Flavobacteriaceae bacterium]